MKSLFHFIADSVVFMFVMCLWLSRPWRYYPSERLIIVLEDVCAGITVMPDIVPQVCQLGLILPNSVLS